MVQGARGGFRRIQRCNLIAVQRLIPDRNIGHIGVKRGTVIALSDGEGVGGARKDGGGEKISF